MLTFRGATVGLGSAMATATNGKVRSLGVRTQVQASPWHFIPHKEGEVCRGL